MKQNVLLCRWVLEESDHDNVRRTLPFAFDGRFTYFKQTGYLAKTITKGGRVDTLAPGSDFHTWNRNHTFVF